MVIKNNFSRELKLTVNIILYWPVQPVYILPVSQTVQKDHWFVPPKLANYTALTSEYRPFRPVNLIRAGTKNEKKKRNRRRRRRKESKNQSLSHHSPHCRRRFWTIPCRRATFPQLPLLHLLRFYFFLFSFIFFVLLDSVLIFFFFYISLFCPLYWIANTGVNKWKWNTQKF